MRKAFEEWFVRIYGDMYLHGPTANGEWDTWKAAWVSCLEDAKGSNKIDSRISESEQAVDRAGL